MRELASAEVYQTDLYDEKSSMCRGTSKRHMK